MSDGSVAAVLFNRTAATATITTSAAEMGLGGSSSYAVRDLWAAANSTSTSTGTLSAAVPSHGAVMLRVSRTGTLSAAPANGTYQLGDMAWLTSSNGWGPAERDQSNGETAAGDGIVASVGGVSYVKAAGVHANSDISVGLGGTCKRFTAAAGNDGEVTNAAASVVFSVVADGTTLYTSPTVTVAGGPVTVDVDVTGRSTLRLVVSDGGNNAYDHADWAGARLIC